MNQYLKNLNKIEFVVTNACTGRCKHCSEGEHSLSSDVIDPKRAADVVRRVSELYDIKTVMTFGGEPLLCPDVVCAIMREATECGIERRQVITNGYFSRDTEKIRQTVERLYMCGVNDLLLSADAFHQETIPLDIIRRFAFEAKSVGIPIRLQPAWLVSPTDGNRYNQKTREILENFRDMDIPVGEGNIIFPEGNARIYLAEYFKDSAPVNPYVEDIYDIRCLSCSPNGDLLYGNIYKDDIMKILEDYAP